MLETRYFYIDEFTRFLDILKSYPHENVSVPKNGYLKGLDEKFRLNYLITKGMCKVSVSHDSGDERVIGYWGEGSMYPIIVTEQDFHLEHYITLKCLTGVTAMGFDTRTTRLIMKEHPEVAYEMIDHYCKYTNLFLYDVTTQAFEPLINRICNILALYHQYFHTNKVPISQSDLSSLAGARRESVVKVLRTLRDTGLIRTRDGFIYVEDIEKMNDYISCLMK